MPQRRMMRNDRMSSKGDYLPDHPEDSGCNIVGCYPIGCLEGEEYFKMLEKTAKRVETWPDWKKG